MNHMKSLMEKAHKGEGGFTLVELLIVILILGAIATVVILNIGGFFGMGECEGYCTEKYNLQTAVIGSMAANNNTVPSNLAALDDFLLGGSAALKFDWPDPSWDTSDGEVDEDATDKPTGPCDCFE